MVTNVPLGKPISQIPPLRLRKRAAPVDTVYRPQSAEYHDTSIDVKDWYVCMTDLLIPF
jgi:hypothetical protein